VQRENYLGAESSRRWGQREKTSASRVEKGEEEKGKRSSLGRAPSTQQKPPKTPQQTTVGIKSNSMILGNVGKGESKQNGRLHAPSSDEGLPHHFEGNA